MDFDGKGFLNAGKLRLFWILVAEDENSSLIRITPLNMDSFSSHTEKDGSLTGIWRGGPAGKHFRAEVNWKTTSDGMTEGTFAYSCADGRNMIREICFPAAEIPCFLSGVKILEPSDGGKTAGPFPEDTLFRSPMRSFQFTFLSGGGENFYFAASDERFHIKDILLERSDKEGFIDFSLSHLVPLYPTSKKKYVLPYRVTAGSIAGGTEKAEEKYLSWFRTTRLYAHRRKHKHLRNIALWIHAAGDHSLFLPKAERMAEDLGLPIALNWHLPPDFRENSLPDPETVDRLIRKNIFLFCTLSGNRESIKDTEWKADAVINENGKVNAVQEDTIFDGSMTDNLTEVQICGEVSLPFYKKLRKKTAVLRERKIPGIFLDFRNTHLPCYHPEHHHAPGGGCYAADGIHRLLARLRTDHPGIFLSTGDLCDRYFDSMDVLITKEMTGHSVFSDMFHGEIALTCHGSKIRSTPEFYLEFGSMILYGYQPAITCEIPDFDGEITAWIRKSIHFYYKHRGMLFDGKPLTPEKVICREFSFPTDTGSNITIPAVLSSFWQNTAKKRSVILFNMTDEIQEWEIPSAGLSGKIQPRRFAIQMMKN